nr:DUF1040 family protein [Photorhabdus tasmaniensis]
MKMCGAGVTREIPGLKKVHEADFKTAFLCALGIITD